MISTVNMVDEVAGHDHSVFFDGNAVAELSVSGSCSLDAVDNRRSEPKGLFENVGEEGKGLKELLG